MLIFLLGSRLVPPTTHGRRRTGKRRDARDSTYPSTVAGGSPGGITHDAALRSNIYTASARVRVCGLSHMRTHCASEINHKSVRTGRQMGSETTPAIFKEASTEHAAVSDLYRPQTKPGSRLAPAGAETAKWAEPAPNGSLAPPS